MNGRRSVAVGLGAAALWAAVPGTAQAHPLGNFTINHYDHVQLLPDRVEVKSVLDRAEIPDRAEAADGRPRRVRHG